MPAQEPSPESEETAAPSLSEVASAMQAARKRIATECRRCGKEIVGTTRRRYCSVACKQAHWRRRRATLSDNESTPPVD